MGSELPGPDRHEPPPPPPEQVAFVEGLASSNAILARVMDEHRAENLGEVLPYMYLGDVVREMERLATAGDLESVEVILTIFEDRLATGSPVADDLMTLGIIENVDDPAIRARIRTHPRLERAYEVIWPGQ